MPPAELARQRQTQPLSVRVVIPCYNEAQRLDTAALREFLEHADGASLLFVDDGSTDATASVLELLQRDFPQRAQLLRLDQNQGKGEAVRRGILLALDQHADAVGYWDADLATPLEAIATFEHALATTNATFILGSRIQLLGRKIERRAHRHYLGRVFATAASLALNLPVYDTQCGAKLLLVTPETRRLFERPFASRWIFDVELIARYLQIAGAGGIYEEPLIRWRDVGESKVRPVDFFRSVGEMLQVYQQYPLGQPGYRVIRALTGAFSRYVVVGGLGTLLHYATLVVAVELGHVPPAIAAVVGASLGACLNYFLNYHLTFASRASHKRAVPRFVLIALLGTLFSGAGVHLGAEIGLHYIVAQLLCTLVFLVLGFLLNRAFTF